MSTGSIIFIVVVLFVLFIALILLFSGLYVVKQQTVAIIERFGKYQKTSTSGINIWYRCDCGPNSVTDATK